MAQIGLWRVTDEGPIKLERGGIDLEKHLEDWIERDPGMLQTGLIVVGRQIWVEGGRLDLLALDPQGRWVLIEIKSGAVSRETISQALDYASCIATMPYEELAQKVDAYLNQASGSTTLKALLDERQVGDEASGEGREVLIFVVGTGSAPGLERMVEYLSQTFGMPISVVSYEVFEMEGGQRVLARHLTDFEIRPPEVERPHRLSVEDVCSLADRAGTGREFRMLFEAAERHGLYPRPFARSIMYTPLSNRTRTLYTVWAQPKANGLLTIYIETSAFTEFFPVPEDTASQILLPAGYHHMTAEDVEAFVARLDRLFEQIGAENA